MSDTSAKFVGNLIIRGKFKCLTGLHIGGSKEKLEIGGVDSPVVRDPRTRYPYVPGSSLKGKLRSLLEYALGEVPETGDVSTDKDIVRLFGIGVDNKEDAAKAAKELEEANKKLEEAYKKAEEKGEKPGPIKYPDLHNIGPSRLVVRDCYPTRNTVEMWEKLDSELLYTEYKSENGINRITSAANPRFIERVVADSEFEFQMIYTAYDLSELPNGGQHGDDANTDLPNLRMALLLLEHNFLGKSGSRGYGRVEFAFEEPIWIAKSDYTEAYKKHDDAEKAKKAASIRQKIETSTGLSGEYSSLKKTGNVDWEAQIEIIKKAATA